MDGGNGKEKGGGEREARGRELEGRQQGGEGEVGACRGVSHPNLKLLAPALPEQEDYTFLPEIWYPPV
jgi:hypothetical protein